MSEDIKQNAGSGGGSQSKISKREDLFIPPSGLMAVSQRKEEFSVAYVHAIATLAGYTIGGYRVDDDGIDISFASKGIHGTARSPRFEAQLKCTSDLIVGNDQIKYDLKKRNYDLLRQEFSVPRILIVLQVPSNVDLWVSYFDMGIIWRNRAYWVCLKDAPASSNTSTVTITIPKANIFDVNNIHLIMNLVARKEDIC